jgi:hypothetical protein
VSSSTTLTTSFEPAVQEAASYKDRLAPLQTAGKQQGLILLKTNPKIKSFLLKTNPYIFGFYITIEKHEEAIDKTNVVVPR